MAVEALTEPLLPRGSEDSSTPPAHSLVNIAAAATATAPEHRRAINVVAAATAKYPAFAVDRDATLDNASASTTAPIASASSPTTPRQDRPAKIPPVASPTTPREDCPAKIPPVADHREDAALEGTFAVDHAAPSRTLTTMAALTSASSPTGSCQDRSDNPTPDAVYRAAALKGASASSPATPSAGRSANPLVSVGPAQGSSKTAKGLPPSPTPASKAAISATGADAPPLPGDSDGSNNQVVRIHRAKRDRSSFRNPRGRKLYRRLGFRRTLKPVPHKGKWDKESFMYTCVLVLLVGLVAYLSTVIDGWSPYLRSIFIGVFGATAGLACIGAMALISETPDSSAQHFAHIISRLTFIVGSLAFEAAVFYLLGEVGFIAWLLGAATTTLGMTHIWRVGSPESFGALVSCLRHVYSKVMGWFGRS